MGQPEAFLQMRDDMFDASGNIGEGGKAFLQGWIDRYTAWVKQHSA
jgi:chromate reductase